MGETGVGEEGGGENSLREEGVSLLSAQGKGEGVKDRGEG